jgi:Family of unknown function (DUF6445)
MSNLNQAANAAVSDDAKADVPLLPSSLFATNPLEQMKIEHREICGSPAVVLDNVYRNPLAVRRFALSLNYLPRGYYPGGYAEVSIAPREILLHANRLLGERMGHQLTFHPHYRGTTFGCIWTRPDQLDPQQRQPHYDYFCDYAGVLFLGPRGGGGGGTTFWRHRATGVSAAPRAQIDIAKRRPGEIEEALRILGSGTVEELTRDFFVNPEDTLAPGYALESMPAWEMLDKVDAQFNRLVIFNSSSFHAPYIEGVPPPFGDFPNQRLTQNFFFNFMGRRE